MLAGVSVDYVIRLEQRRATRPSGQVIEALARALRLNPDERAHLVPLGRTRPARPGHGARPPHTERAAAAGPPHRHPGRRPGRGDDLARREPVYAALMVTRPRCAAYHATASGTTSSARPAVSAGPQRSCGL